jgi:hypothetical protein
MFPVVYSLIGHALLLAVTMTTFESALEKKKIVKIEFNKKMLVMDS